MKLVDSIKCFQKDVESYKIHNKNLMKSKEKQYDFNIMLMQSLERIEKKVDKVTNSRK